MKRQGGILNIYYYVKEVLMKRLHTLRFQLYGILEKVKLIHTVKISAVARGWGEKGIYRWRTEDL